MTQRATTAAKVWKQLLCDPRGALTQNGRLALSDIGKFCRYPDAPTRHDSTGKVDIEATFEAIGMHKVYLRLLALVAINDELEAIKIARTRWPETQDEDL